VTLADTLADTEVLAIGIVGVLTLATLVYLAVSYAIMRAHTDPRPGRHHAAAILREFYYVMITQPLVPLYYFFGRRMGSGNGTPVIFVHGYFQNRADFWWLARRFRQASIGPLYGFNYPWFVRVDPNVDRLERFVQRVCAQTGSDRVTLVAHSLGGLVCLEYAHTSGRGRVAQCITVGTPHAGVKWRGPIIGTVGKQMRENGEFLLERRDRPVAAPTLSIYSTHDNIVHPPATSQISARGGQDVAIDGAGHLSLLFSREVAAVLVEFIGTEDRPPQAENTSAPSE